MSPLRTLALLLAALPYSATQGFLQLPGIPGESTDNAHRGWIEIQSFSFGVTHSGAMGSAAGTGGGHREAGTGAGKVNFTKFVDKSSAALTNAAMKGSHFATATFDVGPEHYTFKTVMVASVQMLGGGGGQDRPRETITLAYESMEIAYTTATGNQSKPITAKPATSASAVTMASTPGGAPATTMSATPGGAPATTMAAHPAGASAAATAAIQPLPPPAVSKNAQLSPSLSPSARAWVTQDARTFFNKGATNDAIIAAARRDVAMRFSAAHLSSGDIDTIVFLVLMQAANDNQQDLKQIMAQSKSQTAARSAATPAGGTSDMSSEMQLRTQMAMDRQSQTEQMLSKIMQSMNNTASGILSNLK